ncbi:tyrosine-type recombinase/integrase [Rugamonas apoptosis]|uniref:Site-specific integrase n=1 Tax=Rugamonas apoptosis TaxID=2758570 RepID=A0A7W2FCE7_9BURK|nr:site-specific integrase [Rugamonas apoptosis]MBA5689170.1 site-specific integrase [Rugamonas apoptosis]
MTALVARKWIMPDGERYCALVDRATGLPNYYVSLYVTTQVRNASLSLSAMVKACQTLKVLLDFCNENGFSMEERILQSMFLEPHECARLRDFCQRNFNEHVSSSLDLPIRKGNNGPNRTPQTVTTPYQYIRLTNIADYLTWLSRLLLGKSFDVATSTKVEAVKNILLALRPRNSGRNTFISRKRGLKKEGVTSLVELMMPNAIANPFRDQGVQYRNQLLIEMLVSLGIRRGELLNIRIEDIDFRRGEILIVRRADQEDDPRTEQPLVKTLSRRLALGARLTEMIRKYIVDVRRKIPNARRFPYLFVTHKSGPTQGYPMSEASYNNVISVITRAMPADSQFSGHDLRHAWNDRYSEWMDQKVDPESEQEQENIRSYWMGWNQGSSSAKTYNARFLERKAMLAGLSLQKNDEVAMHVPRKATTDK